MHRADSISSLQCERRKNPLCNMSALLQNWKALEVIVPSVYRWPSSMNVEDIACAGFKIVQVQPSHLLTLPDDTHIPTTAKYAICNLLPSSSQDLHNCEMSRRS
jgi:hypothetical protein